MKIQTRMLLTLALFGLVLLVTAILLVISFQQIDRLNQQEVITQNIEETARELSYLSNDYLLNRDEAQYARWQSQFKFLSDNLQRLSLEDPRQRLLAQQIGIYRDHLGAVFAEVAASINIPYSSTAAASAQTGGEDALTFARVSWSRLEVQNQSIISAASQLTQLLLQQEDRLRQNNTLLIFILAGVFAGYLLTNYLFIYRRTMRSLDSLQAGIQTISSGNLSYVIDDRQADEFGELSRAFNQMTADLREINAAKAELARQVAERQMLAKQAEFDTEVEVQRRLLEQRELERLDIARDLHDGVLQELMAISYGLKEAVGLTDLDAMLEKLRWVQQALQRQLHEIRAFCNELRPPALAPFGLEKAIRSHVEEFQLRYPALEIHLVLHPDRQTLPEETRMALYRIYQEVMNNVARHSKARQVWVSWRIDEEKACLEIEDDGVGFDVPNDWVAQARSGHLGLVGMRERALSLSGDILIDSRPGQGARVQVTVKRKPAAG